MKTAIFDIGSNSIRLMVGERLNGTWRNGSKYVWTTRLGQVNPDGSLSDMAIGASVRAIGEGVQIAEKEGATRAVGLATGAVREASNKDDFCELVFQKTGVPVRVLTGQEEGLFGFMGATCDFLKDGDRCAVIDLGGATTEVSVGIKSRIERVTSYPIGAVRYKGVSDEGLQRIWEETKGIWNPIIMEDNFWGCIGIGGTFTTLAAIDLKLAEYDPTKVHGHILRRETVENLALQLRYMKDAERMELPGLQANRRDIIVCGAEIVSSFMDAYDLGAIVVSEKDGMEGWEEAELHESGDSRN